MPEGPSIVILKEAVSSFIGKKIISATGNTKKINIEELKGKTIGDFKSWGKHFLICFDTITIRIHFLLFGSYLINDRKNTPPRLSLEFKEGEINFYACSVKEIKEDLDTLYDWSADVMNKKWDAKKAIAKLKENPGMLVCDALLDQNIFAGVGNIIKNEVLYRIKVHPESAVGNLPEKKMKELVKEAVVYSFDFLKWKKEYTLRAHWLAHNKSLCLRCNLSFIRKYLGKSNRRTFFCANCQIKY
jgi:endonuclease-8